METRSLLVVDDDPKSLRLLEVCLRRAGFRVTTAAHALDALARAPSAAPHALVIDAALPEMDGFELLAQLRREPALQETPALFLVREHNAEDRQRVLEAGVDDYVVRPPRGQEVARRVQLMLARTDCTRLARGEGDVDAYGLLEDAGVPDLVAALDLGKRSGELSLRRAGAVGALWLREGRVVDAECGNVGGERAFYRMLLWTSGSYEFVPGAVAPERVTIALGAQALLQEGLRRIVEWDRVREQLPPLDAVYEVSYRSLTERLAEIPDEVNNVLRLFDGHRTLLRVAEDAPFDDLTSLNVIAKLFVEGLLEQVAAPKEGAADDNIDAWIARAPGGEPEGAAIVVVAAQADASAVAARAVDSSAAPKAAATAPPPSETAAADETTISEEASAPPEAPAAAERATPAADTAATPTAAPASPQVPAKAAPAPSVPAPPADEDSTPRRGRDAKEKMGHVIEFPRPKARPDDDADEVVSDDALALKAQPLASPPAPPSEAADAPAAASTASAVDPSSRTLPDLVAPPMISAEPVVAPAPSETRRAAAIAQPAATATASTLPTSPAADDDGWFKDSAIVARASVSVSDGEAIDPRSSRRAWWIGGAVAAAAGIVAVAYLLRGDGTTAGSPRPLAPTPAALASRLANAPAPSAKPEIAKVAALASAPIALPPAAPPAPVATPSGGAPSSTAPAASIAPSAAPSASAAAPSPAIAGAAAPVTAAVEKKLTESAGAPAKNLVEGEGDEEDAPAKPAAKKVEKEPRVLSLAELIRKGNALLKRGKHGAAAKVFRDAASAHVNSAEAAYGLGRALYDAGKEAASLKHLERAVVLKPSLSDAYVRLGAVYQSKGQTGKAKRAYTTYLKQSPKGKYADDLRGLLAGM
jgi:DNA-binding response OmpR family regulator/TolA-binding protein